MSNHYCVKCIFTFKNNPKHNIRDMTTILLYRNPRLLILNPNLAFIRNFAEKNEKIKNPKAVASQILQSSTSELNNKEEKLPQDSRETAKGIITDYPEEPTTCCMSGCANCVWLDYAEKISAYYKDGGEKAMKEIEERVTDSNIKAFLLQELRIAAKEKQ